jgi:hypothetical protein
VTLCVVEGGEADDSTLPIFCRRAFGALHPAEGAFHLQLIDEAGGPARGACGFAPDAAGVWRSPLRGSFGGLGLGEGVEGEALLAAAERRLAGRAEVVLPPLAYAPEAVARELNLFLRRGWTIARHELTQSIPIRGEDFAAVVRKEKRRKLNLCRREGVAARRLGPDRLEAAYQAIAEGRAKKGRPLSMAWPEVARMAAAFPDDVLTFGAERAGALLAAAICVRIDARVLYAFYYGDRPGDEALNPVLPLLGAVWEHWRGVGGALLDLGASTIEGVPNENLLGFKRSLGAELSLKFWLAKDF